MAGPRPPRRPDLPPWQQQGFYANPQYRGKTKEELEAMLPVFTTWEEAIASPFFQGQSDAQITAFLNDVYGLGGYKVQNGRLVSTDHSVRNGLLGGAGMLGGLFGVESLLGTGAATLPGGAAVNTAAGTGMTAPQAVPFMTGAQAAGGGIGAGAATGATVAGGATTAGTLDGGPAVDTRTGTGMIPPNSPTQTTIGGGGAPGVGQNILDWLRSREGAASLATLIPMLAARNGTGGGPTSLQGPTLDQFNKLIGMTTERAQRTDPLHQAVTQLAMSRLPTGVQRG